MYYKKVINKMPINRRIIIIFLILAANISIAQDLISISSIGDIENIKNENSGKVIVINFWASWCKPCTDEFPALVKLNEEYKDRNFRLIFISLDFKEEVSTKLLPFLKNNNVDFTSYYLDDNNPDEIMDYFNKKWDGGIPATFILDTSGKIRKFILGEHTYEYYENEIKRFI
jgi:thiol-disulfide isomerase/thioredoxin